jgi:hypothetical protein
MEVQCCVCSKVRQDQAWVDPDSINLNSSDVSHGYCPTCVAEVLAEVRRRASSHPAPPWSAASFVGNVAVAKDLSG